ncbi:hypothetical protein [Paenibacillus larvae]|uniref:Uncharacterized protein n=2 Tax=Wanderervirus wanderer TaxID=2845749 RepID=A0A345ARK4_9CAUD|nr:hypothetical protein [Paenibacillus larvae]YP_010080262.1 hypothetical protein KMC73_gp41 [Paenibacillus phage Wanderer]AXF40341.1 hypothetical protein LINCOLNB_41 [Paenibacillus phage LincolnB]AXF39458.1 hypothetical protein WANDERER_41 [Paenibacillus phage Wanderer]MDT2173272.1 hypothetical protein [Paenibacillus larvae]MDT2246001.1 hypothetical protein [Paenibacillus larvae]MDT2259614.1 hypothetical protein [Paenibacillus larvae]
MEEKLTKEADVLICVLYKNYLEKRNSGISKDQARIFGSSRDIQSKLLQKWAPEDVDETCWELNNFNIVYCMGADDIAFIVQLTNFGIVYMENRFKDRVESILDYLTKFKNLIPFV